MRVAALSGGVGGARLVDGLARLLDPASLTVVTNVGDDFEHWGLRICPDLDTVMYTLSGDADEARGWGLEGESFRTLERMRALGQDGWFALGDLDLATHLVRTAALAAGARLTRVTADLCASHGVRHAVLPVSDGPRPTVIHTADGRTLGFQEWLVRERAPAVRAVELAGDAGVAPEAEAALRAADVVVVGPSNPYVSIEPILAVPGVREALGGKPIVGVSPIVGGRAIKGPLAEMIPAIDGRAPSAEAVARRYGALVSAMVVERGDEWTDGPRVRGADTVMRSAADRVRLAEVVLEVARELA